ncbi:FxLYD domain-containing protein [Caloramator sp. ALD01]|uniref:FxLYD domain-containing protein n=1 Tax=Caloramator sp. ALD01 TaxID=1031288 RepID=UPI0003F7C672|nr:FxLYD domain-containing protein [Caloramator sp. ALD01]
MEEPKSKTRKPLWKRWWFWVLAVFILIGIAANSSETNITNTTNTSNQTTQKIAQKETKPDLEVLNHTFKQDGFNGYITGQIKNNTDKTFSYVQVEINLYDKNGQQVGSTIDNINNLEPGKTWNFKAIILEDNVHSYKIVNVSGF